jgi:hypothetical protein
VPSSRSPRWSHRTARPRRTCGPTEDSHAKRTRGYLRRSNNTAGPRRATSVPREGPHTHAHTHLHALARTCTHLHACMHARKHTGRTHARVSTMVQRAKPHNLLSTRSRARAQIRRARICSWAHGRYREGGSARTSAVATAAESRLPTDRMRARQHASSISYAIRRCCDAQVSDTAGMAQMPITSRHMCPPISARTNAHTFVCIHRQTNTFYAHTHLAAQVWVCARRGGVRECECQGEEGCKGRGVGGRGCERANARGRGGVDLGASAGTHGHAQLSRAAPRCRLVATNERAAEPRRHPSLVRRRFLPRQPRASARDQSGKRPQCDSALVQLGVSGNRHSWECASGEWSRLCDGVRACVGRNGQQRRHGQPPP